MGRILAIDYGERRVGLALSDERSVVASDTVETIDRRSLARGRTLEGEIAQVVSDYGVKEVVLGLPLNMDGTQGDSALKVLEFAEKLKAILGLPVHTWDERLTSVAAGRTRNELNLPLRKRRDKGRVDSLAAIILLQNYLVYRNRSPLAGLEEEDL